ncbi:conserved hypothetical protein [Histoplasma capsulatum G186AR]|uniref:Uncharacterized protein n=1 Tax=Ajellomyces capsulatus (strain G186AR / H82 / ATCC MYA-2454 / RMSCC 2432) TaxID=447093 RepID=C0NXC9_AJECG|nr:uncharacterized protein HCBG_08121 [Histoplasma capsulatum G186AR]EEH03995.1 conserved hypothetical protein [Histoplasma capsulatum G186AR]
MEPSGIYVILSVNLTEYHWGIYVTGADLLQAGVVHHANNNTGLLALRVGTVPLAQGHA